jgi:hypothetical protein
MAMSWSVELERELGWLVEGGAAWLDLRHPGWAAAVDPGRLAMGSPRLCLACQVAGVPSCPAALERLGLGIERAAGLGMWAPRSLWDDRGGREAWYRAAGLRWRQAIAARGGEAVGPGDPGATAGAGCPPRGGDPCRGARPAVVRHLKTDPGLFDDVEAGRKTFEIRRDDREPRFAVGDILLLHRTLTTGEAMAAGAPLAYSGRAVAVEVVHVLRGPCYGLMEGWVIMSIRRVATDGAWPALGSSPDGGQPPTGGGL